MLKTFRRNGIIPLYKACRCFSKTQNFIGVKGLLQSILNGRGAILSVLLFFKLFQVNIQFMRSNVMLIDKHFLYKSCANKVKNKNTDTTVYASASITALLKCMGHILELNRTNCRTTAFHSFVDKGKLNLHFTF